MKLSCLICAALALAIAAVPGFGQAVTGSLVGTITDSSGGAVPNAKIILKETNTGVNRTANSNDSGHYGFQNLPPGTYSVGAEITGFNSAERRNVDVLVDTTQRIDQ